MAVPETTLSAEYDDNIFRAPDARADVLTVVRPALRVTATQERVTLSLAGWVRAEFFADHDELNNLDNWSADASVVYEPVRSLRLALDGGVVSSLDPADVDPETGLVAGRFASRRTTLTPALDYQFDRPTGLNLRYSFTTFRSDSPVFRDSDKHVVDAAVRRQLVARDTMVLRYSFFHFDVEGRGVQDAHSPRVGLTHAFSPRARLSAEAGPIFLQQPDGGEEVTAGGSLRYEYDLRAGAISAAYERAPDLAGNVEAAGVSQAVTAAARTEVSRELSLGLTALAKETEGSLRDVRVYAATLAVQYRPPVRSLAVSVDGRVGRTEGVVDFLGYSAAFRVTYRLLKWLGIEAGYRFTRQDDRLGGRDFEQSVVSVGLTASEQFRVR